MTCAALLGFAATSHAAYQLNDEVKDATPALLMASQIGVKTNVNPALANLPDKDAIVVMSSVPPLKTAVLKLLKQL